MNKRKETLFAFLAFLLMTLFAGRVVLTHLDQVIIGNDNDVYINPWADWWTQKALSDASLSLWETDYLYFPEGANLSFHSFSHLTTLVSLSLGRWLGRIPGYNITILLNYLLAGFAMFVLARYLTGSVTAAFLAGVVFAFNSHNLYQSSHPVLVSVWVFPWTTYYLLRAVREDARRLALVAAVFVFLTAAVSTVLLVLMAVWLLLLTGYLLATAGWRKTWPKLALFGGVTAVLVLPFIFPLLRDAFLNKNATFITDSSESIVTDLISPFVPHWYLWMKRGLYLGIIPFLLLMIAFGQRRQQTRFWWVALIFSFLMSVGPYPLFFGLKIPNLVLPWSFLLSPVLRNMYRMNIITSIPLAILVGHGWLALRDERYGRISARATFLILFLGIFLEYSWVGIPYLPVEVSSFYTQQLANAPDDTVVAILPTGRQKDKRYMFYQTFHGKRMTGGVISRASETVFDFTKTNPILRAGAVDWEPVPLPSDFRPGLAALADADVVYLVLDKRLMDVTEWQARMPWPSYYEDDLVVVYETGRGE